MDRDPATEFVGRNDEVAAVTERFAEGARVLTLLGPGGVGKTRLALELRRTLGETLRGGGWFCELSTGRTRDEMLQVVAAGTGVPIRAGSTLEDAISQLAHAFVHLGPALVVLDNVEQLVAVAAPIVDAWSRAAPEVRWLITSRHPLELPHEHRFVLGPLDEASAVELFLSRSRARGTVLEPTPQQRSLAAAIVGRVEGIPLSIELAAARTTVLSFESLLERLADPLRVLRGLQSTLAWSWELLTPVEQSALVQCSVFRGGFSVEAAEAILKLPGDDAPPVLDVLDGLVAKSLLRAVGDSSGASMRLTLLETVRAFAANHRDRGVDSDALALRHARYFADRAEALVARSLGPNERAVADELAREASNVTAAFHAVRERDPALALRLLIALTSHTLGADRVGLHARLLDDAASIEARCPSVELRARYHINRSAWLQWERQEASIAPAERAVALGEECGDVGLRADAWEAYSRALALVKRTDDARAATARMVALAEKNADPVRIARTWVAALFNEIQNGLTPSARAYAERAEVCAKAVGSQRLMAVALETAGRCALGQGDFAYARRCVEEAIPRIRLGHDVLLEVTGYDLLGTVHYHAGELAAAAKAYEHALECAERLGLSRAAAAVRVDRAICDLFHDDFAAALRWIEPLDLTGMTTGVIPLYCEALRAGCEAQVGRLEVARTRIDHARARADSITFELLRALLDVYEGFVDAAEAEAACARSLREEAERRLHAAESRLAPGSLGDRFRHVADVGAAVPPLERAIERARVASRRAFQSGSEDASDAPLVVQREGAWFRIDGGEVVRCRGRGSLRGILARLVKSRLEQPGGIVGRDTLVAAGWPGERIQSGAARARLHTAVRTLRDMGLRRVLLSRDEGYLLDGDVPIRVVDTE